MTSVPWKLWEGQVVDGCFPLRRYLGGTDHSAVFLTQYGDPDPRNAAIKLVLVGPNSELLSQWERAAQLSHPNLLRLLRTGSCRVNQLALDYVTTEYADEDLAAVLSERPLTVLEAREMLEPLLEALAYIHAEGMVHGRLKPANIMAVGDQLKLSVDGVSLVGDLGVAPSAPGRYDPPEIRERGCSPVGDVWSFGVTLVEALTQRLPTSGGPKQDPILPEAMPAEFASMARACLRRDPRRRAALGDILAQFRQGSPVPEEQPPTESPAASRRWLILTLVAVAAILAAVVLAGPRLLRRQSPPAAVESPIVPVKAAEPPAPPRVQAPVPEPQTPVPAAPAPIRVAPQPAAPRRHDEAKPGQVVRQVLPDIPVQARMTIHGKVTISIRANVDPAGHVTSARIESTGSRYFANLTLQAAEQWEFEPLKVAGQAAASEWLLRFEITSQKTDVHPSRVGP